MPAPKVPTIKGVTSKTRNPNVDQLKPFQWKPGQSGNPGGRVKNPLSNAYRLRLEEIEPKTGKTYAQLIAIAVASEAMKGKIEAAKELRQATEGDTLHQEINTDKIEAFDYAASLAAIAPRPVPNSDPPGENSGGSDGQTVGENTDGG